MALTPEDVVNKRFQSTKFREGYDQDEVDDFLDEVVVELRRLNQENDELRRRVSETDAQLADLQRRAATPAPAQAVAEPETIVAPAAPVAPVAPVAASAPVPAPAFGEAAPYAGDMSGDTASTHNLLQLARRLHEEHVREGLEKRDALIAEGHATAARVVAEAENAQRAQLGSLEHERAAIERRIEELRTFEREYRQKLKSYIEGQLRELDSASAVPVSTPAPAAVGQFSAPAPISAPAAAEPPATPFTGFAGD